ADMERDGDAVADDGDVADDLLDLADRVGRRGRLRLRILPRRGRPGEEIDDVGGKTGAVRRYQSGMLLVGKIVRDEVMAAVGAGDDEIGTRAFVVAAKQQFRVGHHDRVGVIRVGVYYRRSAVSARCGRVSHSTLATPLIERERP